MGCVFKFSLLDWKFEFNTLPQPKTYYVTMDSIISLMLEDCSVKRCDKDDTVEAPNAEAIRVKIAYTTKNPNGGVTKHTMKFVQGYNNAAEAEKIRDTYTRLIQRSSIPGKTPVIQITGNYYGDKTGKFISRGRLTKWYTNFFFEKEDFRQNYDF